jgi:hypothetical protein
LGLPPTVGLGVWRLALGVSALPWIGATVALAFGPGVAAAQDFSNPAPPWPPSGPGILAEGGLPGRKEAIAFEFCNTRWFGLPDLTTRALVLGAGWRAFRVAGGLSETGDPEIGWKGLGAAAGIADRFAGAAVRGVFRRDARAFGRSDGYEVGLGAWMEAAEALEVWTSAPQLWTQGASPPLRRGLELGVGLRSAQVKGWASHTSLVGLPGAGHSEHAGGLSFDSGPLAVWLTARDHPLRGGIGVSAEARRARVAAEIDGHPVLGETVRLSFGVRLGGAP